MWCKLNYSNFTQLGYIPHFKYIFKTWSRKIQLWLLVQRGTVSLLVELMLATPVPLSLSTVSKTVYTVACFVVACAVECSQNIECVNDAFRASAPHADLSGVAGLGKWVRCTNYICGCSNILSQWKHCSLEDDQCICIMGPGKLLESM